MCIVFRYTHAMVKQISTSGELRQALNSKHAGFVPTMGALHAGHMALVELARAQNETVVVSIFVNPLQFGPGEDLSSYPKPLEEDLLLLEKAKVDIAYLPTPTQMYPVGFQTSVKAGVLADKLCGATRSGHFDGVCTVVAKLFNQVQPVRAYFGEKDYQQLRIIQQMVADLNIPIEIIGVPTVREADGLAMSSRNAYLSEQERAVAPALHQTLVNCAEKISGGENVQEVLRTGKQALIQKGFAPPEYLALCDGQTLELLDKHRVGARLLVAARLGNARLIDNIEVI